jgi:hypothetical protein
MLVYQRVPKTMGNHHFLWVTINGAFSIAMLNYQRVNPLKKTGISKFGNNHVS